MIKNLIILSLSVSLLFSCSNPFSKKDDLTKKNNVVVRGKVKEGGCKKFDL